MLLKIESLAFIQQKTLTKENQAAIEITCYNPWLMFTLTFIQNIFLFEFELSMDSILCLIVQYKISLWVFVLLVLTNPNLAKNFNNYVQIEIYDSLNYFDQSMILIN